MGVIWVPLGYIRGYTRPNIRVYIRSWEQLSLLITLLNLFLKKAALMFPVDPPSPDETITIPLCYALMHWDGLGFESLVLEGSPPKVIIYRTTRTLGACATGIQAKSKMMMSSKKHH